MQLEAHPSAFPNAEFEQLMARYQQADPGAVAVLVERLSPQLYRFFASQLGNRADAEDMLQDTWLRIHRVRHTYRAGDPVLPWVYTIARRVRVDNYRKRYRMSSREVGVDVLPECPVHNDETSSLPSFEELVAVLPESQREVVTMLKVDGLSLEEIARVTASTTGAVKQKAHRAYERLRKILGRAAKEPEQTGPPQSASKGVTQ
jgi:RNA polymerase sigma-70 factor (ECF subfamily)